MRFFCKTYVIAAIWISATPAFSADPVRDSDAEMFPADVSYNPAIPTPDAVLGHALGEQPVRHHKLVEYITTVAGLSDRMSVEVIGYTHERRPILFLVVTSPENHARIDEIRGQHIALTEPDLDVSVDDGMPIVTWLNYGVHGAESTGSRFSRFCRDLGADRRLPPHTGALFAAALAADRMGSNGKRKCPCTKQDSRFLSLLRCHAIRRISIWLRSKNHRRGRVNIKS